MKVNSTKLVNKFKKSVRSGRCELVLAGLLIPLVSAAADTKFSSLQDAKAIQLPVLHKPATCLFGAPTAK